MNYLMIGMENLKYGVLTGVPIYILVWLFLYAKRKRTGFSWNCIFELTFCIYCVALLKTTGILSFQFNIGSTFNYNLLPFVNSSILPVLLNFVLFIPYGFLLPNIFIKSTWNWKKVVTVGFLSSLVIELLQMFMGRYAEIDDLLINTLGTLTGYITYHSIHEFRAHTKKAITSLLSLCLILIIFFSGIYILGNNKPESPDALYAVEDNISAIRLYYSGDSTRIKASSEVYNCFANQLSNCGGHLLSVDTVTENGIWNYDDCFIEIIYTVPQDIVFKNAADFSISNTDRILYNASKNILYWGNSSYEKCLDFMALDAELQEHKNEMSLQYEQLQTLIMEYFLK